MTITAAHAACDAKGRLRLKLTGDKPAALTANQVRVTIGGSAFWEGVAEVFGSLVTVAKSMLPAKTIPKYLAATGLDVPGSASVELHFTAAGAAKPLRKLREQGDAPFVMQGQIGAGREVSALFEFVSRPSELLGPSNPALNEDEEAEGAFGPMRRLSLATAKPGMGSVEPLQDVVWGAVGFELLQLLLDAVRIVATIALLCAPWRFATLVAVTFEPVKRWPVRLIDTLDAFLQDESAHADASIAALRNCLCTAARGSELDYPAPKREHSQWRGPPLPTCELYIGLAKRSARTRVLTTLAKYDKALSTAWQKLLDKQPMHRLCVVLEAELLRGVLYPAHWTELQYAMRLAPSAPSRGRSTHQHQRRGPNAVVVAQPVPSVPSSAAGLLRTVDFLRERVVHEEAELRQKLREERENRRALLSECKIAPTAVCKRSASKGRQQLAVLCKAALFDWLSFFGLLLITVTIYRAPSLLNSLRGINCLRSFHCRVGHQLCEIPLDLLMLVQLLCLSLAFWQGLEMWNEWSELVLVRGDILAARRALSRRASEVIGELCERLCMLVSPVFLWDTYKFLLATTCFGVLVPVHFIGKLLSLMVQRPCTRTHNGSPRAEPSRLQYQVAGALWACLVAFPFVIVFHLAPSAMVPLVVNSTSMDAPPPPAAPPPMTPPMTPPMAPPVQPPPLLPGISSSTTYDESSPPMLPEAPIAPSPPPLITYVLDEAGAMMLPAATAGFLAVVLLLSVLSSGVASSTAGLLQQSASRVVLRCTSANLFALAQMVLEMAQLVALPFLVLRTASSGGDYDDGIKTGSTGIGAGSAGLFTRLCEYANIALLWQPPLWAPSPVGSSSPPILILLAFGALGLWYLLFSLPIVVDELLRWPRLHGHTQHSKLWQLIVMPLHSTLHTTIIMQLIKPLGCRYDVGEQPTLYSDPSIFCWDPNDRLQSTMALCSLLGLAFYLLTVHLLFGDGGLLTQAQHECAKLDIQYSELYRVVGNAVRAACAVCFLLLHEHPTAMLAVLLGSSLFLLAWTVSFPWLLHAPACRIQGVVELRAVGEAIAAWAALSCMLQHSELASGASTTAAIDGDQAEGVLFSLPELTCIIGWLVILLLGLAAALFRRLLAACRKSAEIGALRACAKLAMDIEAYWRGQGGVLAEVWARGATAAWRRDARRVRDVKSLRRVIATLEQHVRTGAQRQNFLTHRRAVWQREVLCGRQANAKLAAERLTALLAELRDCVIIAAKQATPPSGTSALPTGVSASDGPSSPAAEADALLAALKGDAWAHTWRITQANSLKLSYGAIYRYLLQASERMGSFTRGDEGGDGVAVSVAVPAMIVGGSPAVDEHRRAPSVAAPLATVTTEPAQVVITVATEPLLNAELVALQKAMCTATSDFEREELVKGFAEKQQKLEVVASAGRRGSSTPRLTCSQLAELAAAVTLSARRKQVLIAMHPFLSDAVNFHALVAGEIAFARDREDVHRQVASAERQAWLKAHDW